MSSCKFCEICKNTFFTEHLWAALSELNNLDSVKSFAQYSLNVTLSF